MAIGSVSSLGVGSGLELQDILDGLREVDEVRITTKETEKTELESRLEEFDVIKAKLLEMKTHALGLSLSSNFLNRSVSVSDSDILSATVAAGTEADTHAIEVTGLASKSSWQSEGFAAETLSVYVPVTQESTAGYDDADTAQVISEDDTITITHGYGDDRVAVAVDLTAGMTLNDVISAINADSDNDDGMGGTYVTASAFEGEDGKFYLRIEDTGGGSGEENRVMVTLPPADLTFAAPDTTFSYSVGDGADPVEVTVAADTSLSELADLINNDENNPGITASVVDTGTADSPYRLVLTADESGEDSRIFINTPLVDLSLSEVQGADGASLNAQIEVNGIAYERQSNTGIDDIVQGITLNLSKAGTANLTVSVDYQSNQDDITGLVESLNDLIEEITANSGYDEDTEEWGTLAHSAYIKGLEAELTSLAGTVIETGGSYTSLYDLGFEIDREGTVSIDEDILSDALATNFEDVVKLFIGDEDAGVTGLGDLLNERLRTITSSTGLIENEKTSVDDRIDRIDAWIEQETERLDKRYEALTLQFVQLDVYMSQMQSQEDYLTQMFDAFNASKE